MDSFYGGPRKPPAPPVINKLERVPAVPEVSMVENVFSAFNKSSKGCDFSTSRRQNMLNFDKSVCVENGDGDSFAFAKKHVRFKKSCPQPIFQKENVPQTVKSVPDLNGKTFKQIYMANVPDRHLDLSIFESPSNDVMDGNVSPDFFQFDSYNKSKQVESNSRVCNRLSPISETKKLKSIENVSPASPRICDGAIGRDYFAKKREMCVVNKRNCDKSVQNRVETCTQTEHLTVDNVGALSHSNGSQIARKCTEIATPSDEPTIRDLYKIIQQQNEQIMLLQRQVNNLKTSIRQPEVNSIGVDSAPDRPFMKEIAGSPSKKGMFSFDVKATSFEFSIRPQHKLRKQNDFLEPKICEIVECDDTRNNSLRLDESLNVKDSYVSDVPSIEIKMDEYHSSDEDEPPVNVGLTFYQDLMDQVNNILRKVQKQSECQVAPNKRDLAGQTMKAVKQATLQHLKDIGVNLAPIQESSEVTRESELDVDNCNQSEISCAVQQLLMKYLPEDKLAKAINRPAQQKPKLKEKFKPANSEFSFATLQYMKKYNIIDGRKPRDVHKKTVQDNPKILDVTALKLQPKLL